MKKEKRISTGGKRKRAAVEPLLSQSDVERIIWDLNDARVLNVLLPFVLIIEDLLRDTELETEEWQAAAHYLIQEGGDGHINRLMSLVAGALREGEEGRYAAQRAMMAVLARGYDWCPVEPPFRGTTEPVLIEFLRAKTLPELTRARPSARSIAGGT